VSRPQQLIQPQRKASLYFIVNLSIAALRARPVTADVSRFAPSVRFKAEEVIR